MLNAPMTVDMKPEDEMLVASIADNSYRLIELTRQLKDCRHVLVTQVKELLNREGDAPKRVAHQGMAILEKLDIALTALGSV